MSLVDSWTAVVISRGAFVVMAQMRFRSRAVTGGIAGTGLHLFALCPRLQNRLFPRAEEEGDMG
jgi:hypothetical protein